ncbi:MAG: hypothetical protein EAZ08_03870 [Cytophagales bacterium]|nr:MAG: hypothetical protein EAZ08_03870 [Cytophagales bacterium]
MKKLFLLIITPLLLCACNVNLINEHKDMPKMAWEKQNQLSFTAEMPEVKEYNMKLHLRHTSHIQIGNIAVKLTITPDNQPNEAIVQDLLIPIRDKDGHLTGSAMGDICDTEFLTKFAPKQKGKYTFTLAHQMEEDKVESIMEVGFSIEK